MVQVVARHAAEAERVQIAEGNGRKRHHWCRDLVQTGDMRVLKVELDAVHTNKHQERNRPHEKHDPDASFDALAFITEHV